MSVFFSIKVTDVCSAARFELKYPLFVVLFCSEGSNGSSSVGQDCGLGSTSMSSLTSKTSSLSLSSELVGSSPDLTKNGVAHACS